MPQVHALPLRPESDGRPWHFNTRKTFIGIDAFAESSLRRKPALTAAWISASRSDATQLQLKVPFDVDLDEPGQQPCAHHLLEGLAVARIGRIRQEDNAPQV
jgi:hypothetical protein